MKKLLTIFTLGLAVLGLTACASSDSAKKETRDFKAANGTVKIPKKIKKVVVQNYYDEAVTLKQNVVGTDSWSYPNPYLSKSEKKDVVDLGAPMSAEKIAEENPDLIITMDKDKVADYEKIAPTVLVDYNSDGLKNMDESLDYFAELFDAEDAKDKFIKEFDKTADKEKKKLSDKGINPENSTIAIVELSADKVYLYGDNWGRGGQALTRGLGFKESKEMQEVSDGAGYKEVNIESLADLSADYIFIDYAAADKSQYENLTKNPVWKNIKAVKKNNVIQMDYNKVYYYGGPTASKALMSDYTSAILKTVK